MGRTHDEDYHLDVGAMPHAEKVALYHANIDSDPTELADIYLDFNDFDRIEFQVFKQRLSIAVFLTRSIDKSAHEVIARCDKQTDSASHRIPGWEGESDLLLDNRRTLAENATQIGRGAATIAAVAALEGLLDDLLDQPAPDARRRGLQDKWAAILDGTHVDDIDAQRLSGEVKKIAKRRNTFAHELTGSYWPQNPHDGDLPAVFTDQELHDTLHTIGHLAHTLEDLLNPLNPQ